jgi:hypothetical protein
MSDPFDIFHTSNDGTALWRGTAGSMEEAQTRIGELAATVPGEYAVWSRATGAKVVIRSDSAGTE